MMGRRSHLDRWWSGYVKARDSQRLARYQSLLRRPMRLATRIALWLHAGVFLLLLIGLTHAALAQPLPAAGQPGAVNDARYCGEPERTASGRIKRDPVVLRQFAKVFPCPEPQDGINGCPGWSIDHVIPLAQAAVIRDQFAVVAEQHKKLRRPGLQRPVGTDLSRDTAQKG